MDGFVYIITGPRASGKTTAAAHLQALLPAWMAVHADEPFHTLMRASDGRWRGREAELYTLMLEHLLALVRNLAVEGERVLLDGTVLPRQLAPLLTPPAPPVQVLVLLSPLEECLRQERLPTRTVAVHEEKVRVTWQEMQAWRSVTAVPVRIMEAVAQERAAALADLARLLPA